MSVRRRVLFFIITLKYIHGPSVNQLTNIFLSDVEDTDFLFVFSERTFGVSKKSSIDGTW